MNRLKLRKMLQEFLLEDIGELDITSETIFPLENKGNGVFIAKEDGIISGLDVIKEAYHLLDSILKSNFAFLMVIALQPGIQLQKSTAQSPIY